MSGMDLHGVELYISNLINNFKEFRETKSDILNLAYYTFNHETAVQKSNKFNDKNGYI